MRILFHELRKIWRPPVLLALVLLGVLVYSMFLSFEIDYFPNGHPATEEYALCREWAEKYGSSMEADERADAGASYDALTAKASQLIAADAGFAALGIDSWETFETVTEPFSETYTEAVAAARWRLYSEEFGYIGYDIQVLRDALDYYDRRVQILEANFSPATPTEAARLAALCEEPRISGIFPSICTDNLTDYMTWVAVYAVLAVLLLLAPCGAREQLSHMPAEQWTTRTGRRVLRWQFAASMLSALVLFALIVLCFGGVYASLGTQFFWNNPVNTFFHGNPFWFDLTYGQYVLCYLALLLALMLGAAALIFTLSHGSTSYISILLKALPLFLALAFAGVAVSQNLFTLGNLLYQCTRLVGAEAAFCGLLLAFGLALAVLLLHRSQRKELL